MADYLQGVAEQAEDRNSLTIRSVDAYMAARRKDSAMRVCFVPGELHLSIPDEAFYHPVIKELQDASNDLIILDNVSGRLSVAAPLVSALYSLLILLGRCIVQQRTSDW